MGGLVAVGPDWPLVALLVNPGMISRMNRIRVLSPTLISRIAAGECIERPASVVKELVENALDAGAGRVDITLQDGGRQLIQVADDGSGMGPEDLVLAVQQHATSKIATDDDLFNIHTMGFRGEALASIGSVARLRLVSRLRETEVAHELTVVGGQVSPPRPCNAPPGTTVEVRDLFYAVPARRKFLRTNQTEVGHITEQLARIALPQPGVAFSLRHQDRMTHRLAATGDYRQRIRDFYGPELADVLMPIRSEGSSVLVEGLVAPPAESRGSGKWEYVFVNGRFVRDRFVSHAVKEGYRSLIDPHRYPVVFLFITIDPARVDVNVHPTKSEVRWQDSTYIHGQVLAALRDRFLTSRLDHTLQPPKAQDPYRERVRGAMVEFFTRVRPSGGGAPPRGAVGTTTGVAAGAGVGTSDAVEMTANRAEAPPRQPSVPAPMPPIPPASADEEVAVTGATAASGEAGEHDAWVPIAVEPPLPRALQVHNSYLVVETDEGVMIVDQHALHERILYEELRRRMTEHKLEAQRLLLPPVVRVPADRLEVLDAHAATLIQLGLELTPAGPASVALQSFPTLLLERVDHERFVRDLLDLLAEQGNRPNVEHVIHSILDMMACKAAVKAGDPLTADEINVLLQRRDTAERSSHCPHGRPTTLKLSLRDLERQFHRR